MKTKRTNISIQNSIIHVALVTFAILMIPFIAMQISNDWNWSFSDFLIIGILLSGTGFMIELVRHKVRNKNHQIAFIITFVLGCLWIWVELAVGLFTTLGS